LRFRLPLDVADKNNFYLCGNIISTTKHYPKAIMTTTKKMTQLTTRTAGLAAVIACLVVAGCTTRFVDYTLLSTKNVDLSKAGTFRRTPNRVTGEDNRYWFLFIPLGSSPHLKTAVDRAIESVPGSVALVDGVVSVRDWWFIIGEGTVIVEGTPLVDPSIPGASVPFAPAQ
jgi:hypothetical protein